jgi:hypothetical protein
LQCPIAILKDHMKLEYALVENNYDLVKEADFLKQG